tara:strand:- start:856 stop:1170 length:315 start_codon:yes stop_codon:yes gene_type:complete
MAKKGRPPKSEIRQSVVDILNVIGEETGYEIYKKYIKVFPKVTMRSIYYHLKKGLQTEEFVISKVVDVEGDYSWGPSAKKTYYALGSKARPKNEERVKDALGLS